MTVCVAFEVSCPTINCEEVRLVGSLPLLGSWDPFNGVPLTTTEQQYPVWRTAELTIPEREDTPEVVQYKYVKIFSGSAVQWEVGPNRHLHPAHLSEGVNYIEDVMYDIDEVLARRNSGVRIHFQEPLERMPTKSQSQSRLASSVPSRLASSVPSPLRTTSQGQTPIEKSTHSVQELDRILRELQELEPTFRFSKQQIQQAIVAVRSALAAEHGNKARDSRRSRSAALGSCGRAGRRGSVCASISLLLVPLLPMLVAAGIFWRYPEAQRWRGYQAMRDLGSSWTRSWRKSLSWTCPPMEDALMRGFRHARTPARKRIPISAKRGQGGGGDYS